MMGDWRIGKMWSLLKRLFPVSFLLFVVTVSPLFGHPLDQWHLRSSSTTSDLNDVTFGNGTAVAVGQSGAIVISYDFLDWTSQGSGPLPDLNGVTFGNGIFVAVGDGGTILTSPDGITWESRNSTTVQDLFDVAYGNGVFVAGGGCAEDACWCDSQFGVLITSVDGMNWTDSTPIVGIPPQIPPIKEVIFGNGLFVVAGNILCFGDGVFCRGEVYTSSDGVSWTPRTTGVGCPSSLFYGNGKYFASGQGYWTPFTPDLSVSSDGITWEEWPVYVYSGTTYGEGYFVAPFLSDVSTSTDGLTWSVKPTGATAQLNSSLHVNRTFVIVGGAGTILQSDPFGFHDVPSGYFADSHINMIRDYGITAGCGNGNYCPDDPISRGQMAVFLVTSLGQLPVQCTGRFIDVPVGHLFCGFIEQLFEGGITGGCDLIGGTFCPDEPVTRGQMAVFIESALGNPPNTCAGSRFTDITGVTVGATFCGFIERLAEDGITGGCTPTTFCPNDPVTRAQMAVFLVAAPAPLSP